MYFVLAVAVLFVMISIYFYFQTEKLQRQLLIQKRDSSAARKESQKLTDSMAFLANQYEEFAKHRLQSMKDRAQSANNEQSMKYVALISPLINNYATIFRECVKESGKLKAITKKCYENSEPATFKSFSNHIAASDANVRRMWSNNNLNGFIALVENLLLINKQGKKKSTEIDLIADTKPTLKKVSNS